jgi:ABC-2 type transport system permease protein
LLDSPDLRVSPPRSRPIATTEFTERTSEPPRLRVGERVRELATYREILVNLVRKELKVKYTASVLGTIWSLLNPVVFLAVFTFVAKVLGAGLLDYPVFLLAGLLGWNLFSVSLSGGAQSVLANANLVKKVYFPREVLPLATVGVALVDFVLQSLVFAAFLVVFGYGFVWQVLWLYPLSFVALLVLTVAVTFWVSALNVRYRDVQHLLGLALLVWFWLTPIVYPVGPVSRTDFFNGGIGDVLWLIYLANPVTWIVSGFQHALYHSADAAQMLLPVTGAELTLGLAAVLAASTFLLWLTWRLFFSMSGDFAEEL